MNLTAEIFGKIPSFQQSFADVLQNMSFEKFRKFRTKLPMSQPLYNQVTGPSPRPAA